MLKFSTVIFIILYKTIGDDVDNDMQTSVECNMAHTSVFILMPCSMVKLLIETTMVIYSNDSRALAVLVNIWMLNTESLLLCNRDYICIVSYAVFVKQ